MPKTVPASILVSDRADPASTDRAHVRILLIDDHPLFREGMRVVLGQALAFEIAGEAATAREAIELGSKTAFDIAVVDVGLPDLTGVSVTRELRRVHPRCKVLALSMVEEPYRVAEMLRAGASGYALKSQPMEEILDAIRAVLRGDRYLAPRLSQAHIEGLLAGTAAGPIDELSPREREVFDLIVHGFTNERIGAQLFISARTVETHRQNLMDKLHVNSVVELVRLAARYHLIRD